MSWCDSQAYYFPIDPRLNFFVANKLLNEFAVSSLLATPPGAIDDIFLCTPAAQVFGDC